VTSGIRVGTAAITTRGLTEKQIPWIVSLIDRVITSKGDEGVIAEVKKEVIEEMSKYPLFAQ